ncbi:MAG: ShlB/FhaC/HecB family hemolysin secretion/activation protein [Geothermobacteraceae bacterium]
MATDSATEELRLRQRQELERRRSESAPLRPRLQTPEPPAAARPVPDERCFPVERIELAVPEAITRQHPEFAATVGPDGRLAFLRPILNARKGECLGVGAINELVRALTARLLENGSTTTRILIPPQNLADGILRLDLVPGYIEAIEVDGVEGPFALNPLPLAEGDLLDLNALEQGLEQFELPGQQVRFDLEPGREPGASLLRIHAQRQRPVRLRLQLEDSGSRATGRWRLGGELELDGPFAHHGRLHLGWNGSPQRAGDRRADGLHLDYRLPLGWWQLRIDLDRGRYRQSVAGINQSFISSGDNRRAALTLSRTLARDRRHKLDADLSLAARESRSFIEGVEIKSQRRLQTDLELALRQTVRLKATDLSWRLAHRRGLHLFGAREDFPGTTGADPTFFYRLFTFDLGLARGFALGETQALAARIDLHAQYSSTPLYTQEQLAIGGRSSVRGFDGEQILSAEHGVIVRSELEWRHGSDGPRPFAALDWGRVSGPSARQLAGRELVGSALGLRWSWRGLELESFAGWPLVKPRGLQSEQPAWMLRVEWKR